MKNISEIIMIAQALDDYGWTTAEIDKEEFIESNDEQDFHNRPEYARDLSADEIDKVFEELAKIKEARRKNVNLNEHKYVTTYYETKI